MTITGNEANAKLTPEDERGQSGAQTIAPPDIYEWTQRRQNKQNRLAALLPWMPTGVLPHFQHRNYRCGSKIMDSPVSKHL
jgi:hypothetical protein